MGAFCDLWSEKETTSGLWQNHVNVWVQIISCVPPSILARAMVDGGRSLEDELLVERLGWLRAWLDFSAQSDVDQQVCSISSTMPADERQKDCLKEESAAGSR